MNEKKKEENATKLLLAYWMRKLDKSMKALAMAFEDHAEAHQNVLQFVGLFIKESEEKIAKLEAEIAELKTRKVKKK